MTSTSRIVLALALCLALSSSAWAGTISGTVSQSDGAGVGNAEVQLWVLEPGKGLTWRDSVGTGRDGTYSFAGLEAGNYRVLARLSSGAHGSLTDRWFDAAEPLAEGWNPDSADSIELIDEAASVTGIDIVLLSGGSAIGQITGPGGIVSGARIRVERLGTMYGHDDVSRAPCCGPDDRWGGRFVMRGLIGGADYRVLAYDPTGAHESVVAGGSWEVTSGTTFDMGPVELPPIGTDPYEPNNSAAAPGSNSIPPDLFHGEAPGAFITDGALIGPRGADTDWYCMNVRAHDRFIAYTSTDLEVPGEFIENPWLDPTLSAWAGGTTLVAENDDGESFGLNSVIDTGDIPFAGRYCFVVSTFGDTAWDAAGQQTAGRYTLVVELGNRFPVLSATLRGGPVPPPPGRAVINEGELFRIDFSYSDPDGDELTLTAELLDVDSAVIEGGELTYAEGFGSFVWTVPDDAADHSPFQLTLGATDGEFTASVVVLADPVAVNIPPFAPVQLSPENGGTSLLTETTLVVENATDLDGDPLSYDFELYLGATAEGIPTATATVEEGTEGTTLWTGPALEENQLAAWRVRANDGLESGVSEWSPTWTFVVNQENELANPPQLVKPDQDSTVPLQTPTLSAENTTDPDGDSLAIVFEIASDIEFADIVRVSPPISQETASTRTEWTVGEPLEWGGAYYARAYAEDPLGNPTEYSNIRGFRVKVNLEPAEPQLAGELSASCDGHQFTEGAPTEFVVPAVADPEGEAVTIDFRVYDYEADLDVDPPVFQATVAQEAFFVGDHVIPVDPQLFEENGHYLIRIQAADSETDSDWGECDFWINSLNEPPGPLVILSPEDGEELSANETDARIVVQNAVDPDGTNATVRWCIVDELAGFECADDPTTWNSEPQTEGTETTFFYPNIYEGAELLLMACAMDDDNECGLVSTVSFTIDKPQITITPAFCACGVTSSSSERGGWAIIVGLVALGLRRRPSMMRAA